METSTSLIRNQAFGFGCTTVLFRAFKRAQPLDDGGHFLLSFSRAGRREFVLILVDGVDN